jgi:2-polyprenyl-6-methoxyphenol hydroxylase-like FAD-dependent oxidoreductase
VALLGHGLAMPQPRDGAVAAQPGGIMVEEEMGIGDRISTEDIFAYHFHIHSHRARNFGETLHSISKSRATHWQRQDLGASTSCMKHCSQGKKCLTGNVRLGCRNG